MDSKIASAGGVAPSSASLDRCSTWRVVPARIAISLRLERLARSRPRPPHYSPSCVPAVGRVGSVCRLRLSILGGGASARALHPGSLLPRCSQLEPSTLVIGWSGGAETATGQGQPPSEWRVRVPPARGDPLLSPDLSNGALLAIPRDGRDRLVLTLGLAGSPSQEPSSSPSEDNAEGKEKQTGLLGSVSIDWKGLSRLPLYSTGYFVDAHSSSTSRPDVPQPMYLDLELVAARSSLQSPKRAATGPTVVKNQEVTLSSNVLTAYGPNIGGVNSGAAAENAAPPKISKQPMGDEQAEENHQRHKQDLHQEQEQERDQQLGQEREKEHHHPPEREREKKQEEQRNPLATSCRRTTGFTVRVALHLETSPIVVPYELSLTPAAARGPATSTQTRRTPKVPARHLCLGDFRDPCRRQRVPYLRFLWPWDDYYLALAGRRTSLVPDQPPWQLGSRRSVTWPNPRGTKSSKIITGEVSARLPITLSGFDGSIGWAGDQELRKGAEGFWTDPEATEEETAHELGGSLPRPVHLPAAVMVVEAYDMGTYSRLEHRAAIRVQRLWRRGLEAIRNATEWWEYDAEMRRYNAAIAVQACYRGWKGRLGVQAAERERELKGAAASVLQRRWRWVQRARELHVR